MGDYRARYNIRNHTFKYNKKRCYKVYLLYWCYTTLSWIIPHYMCVLCYTIFPSLEGFSFSTFFKDLGREILVQSQSTLCLATNSFDFLKTYRQVGKKHVPQQQMKVATIPIFWLIPSTREIHHVSHENISRNPWPSRNFSSWVRLSVCWNKVAWYWFSSLLSYSMPSTCSRSVISTSPSGSPSMSVILRRFVDLVRWLLRFEDSKIWSTAQELKNHQIPKIDTNIQTDGSMETILNQKKDYKCTTVITTVLHHCLPVQPLTI